MMKRYHSVLWLLLAVLFAIGATVLILSHMVTDPAHVMVDLTGDCGKNYFTFIYHTVYDHGIWFSGMNYPYGEHIIYADGQPAISTMLGWFTKLDAHQALAAMNVLISLSYVLAIVFTYKILLRFGVSPFIAILFACLINMLCPQVIRVRAHFALSYLCLIPMLFYWNLLYHHTRKWKWVVYIFIFGLFMSFVHLYFGAIIFFWLVFYSTGCVLFAKGLLLQRLKYAWPMLAVVALLFIAIKAGIALTDPVTDRPSYPVNKLEYVTHIKDIFSSVHSPLWQLASRTGFNKISDGGEGYSYLGVVTIIVVLFSFLLFVIKRRGKRQPDNIVSEDRFSPVWLFVAFCSLLLAMGVPFIWHMSWLMDYVSLFKQFRSMGRFVWTFYYIISIYAVVVIYNWYIESIAGRNVVRGYGLLVISLVLWSVEVSGYVSYTDSFISKGRTHSDEFFNANETDWQAYLSQNHLKSSEFQGLLLLPFFAYGSEKLWVSDDPGWPLTMGIRASTQLHLPIVDIMMSRTSWSVTEKQVKTAAGPYADKPMLRDLTSNKPFLLLVYDGAVLDPDQQYLLRASDLIGHHFQNNIYACYPERIRKLDESIKDSIGKIAAFMKGGQDSCINDKGAWYVQHFNDRRVAAVLFGTGAQTCIAGDDSLVATCKIRPVKAGQLYEFSCWFLLSDKDSKSPDVLLQILDSTGKVIQSVTSRTINSTDNKGMWFRNGLYFSLPAGCCSVTIKVLNEQKPSYKIMDELLLRPADAVIMSKDSQGNVMVNNHCLTRK